MLKIIFYDEKIKKILVAMKSFMFSFLIVPFSIYQFHKYSYYDFIILNYLMPILSIEGRILMFPSRHSPFHHSRDFLSNNEIPVENSNIFCKQMYAEPSCVSNLQEMMILRYTCQSHHDYFILSKVKVTFLISS